MSELDYGPMQGVGKLTKLPRIPSVRSSPRNDLSGHDGRDAT